MKTRKEVKEGASALSPSAKREKRKRKTGSTNAAPSISAGPVDEQKNRKKKHQKKGKFKPKGSPLSVEEKENLAMKALRIILKGIEKNGEVLKAPKDWTTHYQHVLGSYKAFCLQHPNALAVVDRGVNDDGKPRFGVVKAGPNGAVPPGEKVFAAMQGGGDWKAQVLNAWTVYCKSVPDGEEWSVESFLAVLPQRVLKRGAGATQEERAPGEGRNRRRKRVRGAAAKEAGAVNGGVSGAPDKSKLNMAVMEALAEPSLIDAQEQVQAPAKQPFKHKPPKQNMSSAPLSGKKQKEKRAES